ncbi:hypothetical protein XENOCAPTIV_028129, partial [Xenoophorus captivus]
ARNQSELEIKPKATNSPLRWDLYFCVALAEAALGCLLIFYQEKTNLTEVLGFEVLVAQQNKNLLIKNFYHTDFSLISLQTSKY